LFLDESIKQFQVSYYGIIILTSLNRVLLSIFDEYQTYHNDASLKFSILSKLDGKSKVKQVAIHQYHGLILMESGTIFMFGSYLSIRKDQTSELSPLPLSFLKSDEVVIQCYLGFRRTFLFTSIGRLFSFGDNRMYVLGDGTSVDREEPVEITKFFK
jgi:alpha-tubulin suppressor-like RCC1 family protein